MGRIKTLTSDVAPARCSQCGHAFDQATYMFGEVRPKPEDLSLCIECGHLMVFTADLSLREVTPEEAATAASNPAVTELRLAIALKNIIERRDK